MSSGIHPCFPFSASLQDIGPHQCAPGVHRVYGAGGLWRGSFCYGILEPLSADQEILHNENR
jgi:hypothetical protein